MAGVLFWTKPRVRVYSLLVAGLLVAGIGVSLLVFADVLEMLRGCGSGWSGRWFLWLVTLSVRISARTW